MKDLPMIKKNLISQMINKLDRLFSLQLAKKLFKSQLIVIMIFLISCSNNINEPPKISNYNSGVTIIGATDYIDDTTGFSFEKGDKVLFPNMGEDYKPDFFVTVATNERGDPLSVLLWSSDWPDKVSDSMFACLNCESSGFGDILFDTLTYIPYSNQYHYTYAVSPLVGNVYAIKTSNNKHGMILILESYFYQNSQDSANGFYRGHVKFKWKYQPNGSRNLLFK
ncbi:hypothetical protein D9V86_09830 [Bacteroidetes/Chlorobi group bacterium ChocPot_Mid]|nr:MAG: hypothetical protein D9V86_09830 [Bacteroidetes/Chlorobi group bacterium ChocPot_Mid]